MHSTLYLKREMNKKLICARSHSPTFFAHFHSHIEIYLILSGEVEIIINDRKKLLGAGEISVAMSYDTHGYRTPDKAEAINLIIPTEYFSELLPQLSGKALPSPFIKDTEVYSAVLNAMEGIMKATNEISVRGYVYTVLGKIFDLMSKTETPSAASHSFRSDILIYIGEHFKEDLTLTSLAQRFGYAASYLSRSFKEAFGISFIDYLTVVRLREAVLLLSKGGRSITECALESGFGSMRNFYRAFGEHFGCTPREYLSREMNKSE